MNMYVEINLLVSPRSGRLRTGSSLQPEGSLNSYGTFSGAGPGGGFTKLERALLRHGGMPIHEYIGGEV